MKRAEAARSLANSVADDLFATEAAIDEAMMKIAAFAHRLPLASREAGFSATRGQTVFESLAKAMTAQAKVRAAVVDVHNQLAALKEASPMRTQMIGGGSKDAPPDQFKPMGRLAVVG